MSGVELMERAAGAAAHLGSLVDDGTPVPALFTTTADALAYVIGGAAAGRPVAPLGPRLTATELGPCMDGLRSPVVLTEPAAAHVAEEVARPRGVRVAVIEDPPWGRGGGLRLDGHPDEPAFWLHTSGTTGAPKAVAYRNRPLVARVKVNAELCRLGPGAVYATGSPFHHIAGLGNHAVALAAGAAIAPVPNFSLDAWRALGALGATHALLVPTMIAKLLDAGCLGLPTLTTLQYGAAPVHPDTLRGALRALPGVRLINLFGQTEGSPITCLTPEDHDRIAAEGRADLLQSVGRPAPGVELRIDDTGPDGVGEVVARAAHFFEADEGGWLHTGDLGRLDDEGYLFLSGRRGDRIIRGGENVYPSEVEHVLELHPGVQEAAVVGVDDKVWGHVVRAVVVPAHPSDPPTEDELRAHARGSLAGFKVPTEWCFVEELPRGSTGKVLRRALT